MPNKLKENVKRVPANQLANSQMQQKFEWKFTTPKLRTPATKPDLYFKSKTFLKIRDQRKMLRFIIFDSFRNKIILESKIKTQTITFLFFFEKTQTEI